MPILAIAGLTLAPVFIGFLMEPLFPLGHWAWGVLLFFSLLPSILHWRGAIWSYVSRNVLHGLKRRGIEASVTSKPMSSSAEVQKRTNLFSWPRILLWPTIGAIFAALLLTLALPQLQSPLDCLKNHAPQISWAVEERDTQHLYDEVKVLYPRLEECGLRVPMLEPRQTGHQEYDNTWHGFHETSLKVLYRKIRNGSFDLRSSSRSRALRLSI